MRVGARTVLPSDGADDYRIGWADQDEVGVQIEDQGAGFDPEAVLAAGASSGLAGIRERVVLLGGKLTVESAPGTGTRLTAEFPLGDQPLERRGRER